MQVGALQACILTLVGWTTPQCMWWSSASAQLAPKSLSGLRRQRKQN
jgi:hypothetical protein